MISFWAMVFFLIGDSACSSSEMTAKEGSCVTVHVTLDIWGSGYIVWLKDAVWNEKTKDYEGTIVHSLKPDKPTASEFENRVSVASTGSSGYSRNYELTINNLRLNDSGNYSVRYYDKPPYTVKKSSKPERLEVQKNPCQVSVTGPKLVQTGAEVILRCSTVGPCKYSPEWRSSGPGLASSEGPDTQGAKTAQLSFKADWSHDGVTFSCWPSPGNDVCASRNITLAVEYGPRGTKIKASCCQGGVKAGESLTLTCETDARPEPYAYTWFRVITEPGGQRGPGRMVRSDGRDLRFWHISAGDAGEYTCQAKNIISAQNSTALRVDVLYGPTGLTMSMDSEVRESSLVTIHCSVESFPLSELTLTWAPPSSDRLSDLSRDPKRLPGKYTDQPTRTSLVASFIASVGDAGRYTCRAKNSEDLKETTKDLVVHYAPKDVRATANPGGEVTEKTNLDLSCEARSNPGVAAYTWFKLTGRGAREVGKGRVLTLGNLSEAHTGQYLCRTRNKIGEGNSSVIDVTVRYGPRKTEVVHNMTSRGQPVKESAVALMCRSQSYPPIQSYKWHIQKDVNAEPSLRPGQNLTIGSDEEGIYYCSAENEISSSSSERIVIRFYRSSTRTLIMATSCFFVVIIILVIVIVILLYRKRRKSARQRLENVRPCFQCPRFRGSRSDTWETLVMDGMGGPQRSRETLSTVMAPPPGPPANQHGHDSELYASPHTVNSPLKFPEKTKQAKSSGLPHRDGGGPAEEDGINYASLQFPGKGNRIDPKPEETECVYSKLAKPIRKQEVEAEEAEYENVKEAVPRWTERESDSDSETSDEDPDVCYTTVSFAPQAGPPGPRGAHCQGDSDTSDEDDYKSQYSNVKA